MRFAYLCFLLLSDSVLGFARTTHDTLDLRADTIFRELSYQNRIVDTILRVYETDRNRKLYHPIYIRRACDFSYGTLFSCDAIFFGVTFSEPSSFFKAFFKKDADFTSANFKQEAEFTVTVFYQDARFNDAIFGKHVDFTQTTFAKNAIFDLAHFGSTASFSRLVLDSAQLSFVHTFLPDTIDFSYNSNIKNDINLQFASFQNENEIRSHDGPLTGWPRYWNPWHSDTLGFHFHYINLFNSDISKFKLDYQHFRLYFKDRFTHDAKEISKDKKAAIYESLLKNFHDHGQIESAINLDIEYQYFKRDNSSIAYLLDWWWRFGYEKERIFLHILFFLLFLTITTYCSIHYLHYNVYELDAISEMEKNDPPAIRRPPVTAIGRLEQQRNQNQQEDKIPAKPPKWKSFSGKRLWYAFIYTATIFFVFSLKIDKLKLKSGFKSILGTLYVVIVSTIGLLCLGYVANFVLQK